MRHFGATHSIPGTFLQRSRHGTVYYFRRRIPIDLWATVGHRHVVASLETADRNEAVIRARMLAAKTDAAFTRMRAMKKDRTKDLEVEYLTELDMDDLGRVVKVRIETDPNNPEDQAGAERALEAVIRASNAHPAIAGGNPQQRPTKSLKDAALEFLAESGLKATTRSSYFTRLEHALAFFGGNTDVHSITQQQLVAYAKHVRANAARAGKTQGNYITVVMTFINWHLIRAGLPRLTAATLKPKRSGPLAEERKAFTLQELGYTVLAVSDRLGVSVRTLQRHFAARSTQKGHAKAALLDKAREDLLKLISSDELIKAEAASLVADDLAHSRHLRDILLAASARLDAHSLRDAVLVMRSAAAYSTAIKNTSDTLRRSLRVERFATETVETLPELQVRELLRHEIEAIRPGAEPAASVEIENVTTARVEPADAAT